MPKTPTDIKCEDTVQCLFFCTKKYSNNEWQKLCDSINETVTHLSQEYIWHRDEFKVVLPIMEDRNDIQHHLMSITCFGDNIEDEWFIVYLLLELTKKYNDIIIQIEDNDGDFLLIEAADYLPTWANPDTTVNRVFIYDSYIHIVPPHIAPTDVTLTLNDALRLVTQKPEETRASLRVQQAILKRIGNYPQQVKENCHKAVLKLPLELGAILTLKPSLISPLVNTFCSLDALDAKFCRNIDTDNCFNVEIKFTKFLYAMLLHTRFPNGYKFKTVENDKKIQLGLKLICGYKTIMAKSSVDVFSTLEFNIFINSLTKNGYFKGNLEGSNEYLTLLTKAKTYFTDMECPIRTQVCNVINNIKLSNEFENIKKYLKHKNDEGLLEEDDDTWLNIHPDQLNEFLNNHYGRKVRIKNNDPITPHIINSELANFLKETSDFEGVEGTNKEKEQDNIAFNSEQFVSCLEKMLNIISNEDVSYESDQSEFSNDSGGFEEENTVNLDQDRELASKLKTIEKGGENKEKAVMDNFLQSMKEEGLSGPASTVFRTIGVKKSDLIDSDDDE